MSYTKPPLSEDADQEVTINTVQLEIHLDTGSSFTVEVGDDWEFRASEACLRWTNPDGIGRHLVHVRGDHIVAIVEVLEPEPSTSRPKMCLYEILSGDRDIWRPWRPDGGIVASGIQALLDRGVPDVMWGAASYRIRKDVPRAASLPAGETRIYDDGRCRTVRNAGPR